MTSMELKYCKAKGVNVLVLLEDIYEAGRKDPVGVHIKCLNKAEECCGPDCKCELERDWLF